MKEVIQLRAVEKHYGDLIAVDDVSFDVYEGEIFCLVGPNGAGKTTTIEIAEGLRRPDEGEIRLFGADPFVNKEIVERIGVQLQDENLSFFYYARVGELCKTFASFYRKNRVEEMLERLSLKDKEKKFIHQLSAGERQKVAIALALINDPELLFFDEITTGLDPRARMEMWSLIEEMKDEKKSVFFTTHYMDEAERLADRVGIMDRGRIIALDTPENLIKSMKPYRVSFRVKGEAKGYMKVGDEYMAYTDDPDETEEEIRKRYDVIEIKESRTTLDDVFLTLTGREKWE